MMTALPAKPRYRVRTDGHVYQAPTPAAQTMTAPGRDWALRGGSGYMRGEQMPLFFHWHPALREANDDVRAAWRLATARTVNTLQNSGWFAGAAEQSAAHVVGNGLELHAKPNALALGWTQAQANEWARLVESRFSVWAGDARACDAGARFNFGQLLWQAYKHWMATGEILATFPWIERLGSEWRTKLRVLPAWRMSLRSMLPLLINGVRLSGVDSWSPQSYLLWRLTSYGVREEVEVSANDGAGRPVVAHIFDGDPDQVRGISPWTPVLKVTRQFDQLADATLTAALIQAVFAAMFTSDAPSEDVLEGLQGRGEQHFADLLDAKVGWYRRADLNLGVAGKILHGFPGDDFKFFRSEHPNATYEPFARFLLREISRVAALTYPEFTGDYSGETFSSAKMGTTAIWPRMLYRRKHIVAPLAQRAYEAWLEEDIDAGRTPFPGGVEAFLANRAAATQAHWRGPAKPQADDLKTANALLKLQELGVPDTILFGELGGDVDDWYELRKREQDRREELELKERAAAVAASTVPPSGTIEGEGGDQAGTGGGGQGGTGGGQKGASASAVLPELAEIKELLLEVSDALSGVALTRSN
jgi:lambda family phage portal protein